LKPVKIKCCKDNENILIEVYFDVNLNSRTES